MGQYQARTKSVDEEQAPGTPEHRLIKDGDAPVFGSPIGRFVDDLWYKFCVVIAICYVCR